jgi:hypothetical protein
VLRLAAALLVMAAMPAQAQLYTDDDLASARRQSVNVARMLTEDIVATLPRDLRARTAGLRAEFPVRVDGNPLGVFANPAAGTVIVPLETLRFLDDYATLLAWDNVHGCESGYIDTYLYALLRERRTLPPPLAAFGIDRDAALADALVDRLAGDILKSQVFFLLSHELGHILLDHAPGEDGAASRRQELAADAFALDRFAALGTMPLGMAAWFYAARYVDPTGDAVEGWSHPVFTERLRAVADRLAREADAFSFAEPDFPAARKRVAYVVSELYTLARLGADEEMLTLLPHGLLALFPLSGLGTACNPS